MLRLASTSRTIEQRLNRRQRDILHLVTMGFHNAEIGLQVGISERSVRGYLGQLFLLFDVNNRTELAIAWLVAPKLEERR